VVPLIEASSAFKNNGAIIIWNDETEGGDATTFTDTEIVISPLAKGNAYASTIALNHSSDIKTMQEIFSLGPSYLNNTIPSSEYSPAGGSGTFNTVSASNDLSDLFQAGTIPAGIPAVWLGGAGNWSNSAKWGTNLVPNAVGTVVEIDNGNATASNVTLDQIANIASLTLDVGDSVAISAGKALTINGPGATTLKGTLTNSGTLNLIGGSITNTGTFTQSTGALSMAGNFSNSGTATIGGSQTWSAGTTFTNTAGTTTFNSDAGSTASSPLSISVTSGTVSFASSEHLASLSITAAATVTALSAVPHHLVALGSLTNSGLFDLSDNDLVVQGTSAVIATANLTAITNELKAGFNAAAGYWNGATGIVSSKARSDSLFLTTLGIRQSDGTPFDGTSTTANDVLVKYTYFGDADLSGTVTGADYQQIDNGFGNNLTGWSNGDFNYDGIINGSDFALIDNTFNQINATTAGALAIIGAPADNFAIESVSPVPEPIGVGLICFAFSTLTLRRRRCN
jgi:hypothetical protein